MPATVEQIKSLSDPTPAEEIGTKPGKGGSGDLSYVDARFDFDWFDAKVGPENWQVQIAWSPPIFVPAQTRKDGTVIESESTNSYPLASIGVLTENGWVWKTDIGDFSDISSVKGAVSDSIKRAGVLWGVARDLYPKPQDKRTRSNSRRQDAPRASGTAQDATEAADVAESAVVGQRGLTQGQRGKLFAALKDAGVKDDDRKDIVKTVTGKFSVKDMTSEDLDLVLAFLEGAEVGEATSAE